MTLKQCRLRSGLTQKQVAENLGLDRTTVSKWDINASFPKSKMLFRIALLYGCSVSDLLSSGNSEPYCNSIENGENAE
jgi:transcriptional regulator with XRE-family HTH domain